MTSRPVDTVNIATDAASAGDATDVSDVERLMRQVAAEMNVDAQQAIDGLKKDKDLWNRVERLKKDGATRHNTAIDDDDGEFHYAVSLNWRHLFATLKFL